MDSTDLHWNKAWLKKEYIENKRTLEDMAKEAKISPSMIYRGMVYYGIPRRRATEASFARNRLKREFTWLDSN